MDLENETTDEKINRLFELEKIERHHLECLDPLERGFFMSAIQERLDNYTGEALDKFIEKVRNVVDYGMLYDMNHGLIARYIKLHINEHGSRPTITAIAFNVGLSRKAVRNHLKALNSPERAEEQDDLLEAVVQEVIDVISKKALAGDLKAAKLLLDVSHRKKSLQAMNERQKTYAMLNKTIINRQVIDRLKPEEVQQVEQTFQTAWARPGWGDWNWDGGQQGYKAA